MQHETSLSAGSAAKVQSAPMPLRPPNVSRYLYSFAVCLALPFLVVRLAWRGFRNPPYWKHWRERFGGGEALPAVRQRLWLHAVSLGEMRAALPLLDTLRVRYPFLDILITTTTPTGRAQAVQVLGQAASVRYFPFDLGFLLGRFLNRTSPTLAVIMEKELWPNMLHHCAARNIPVLLANVLLSERSARGYRRFRSLFREPLSRTAAAGVQSEPDGERLASLGVLRERIHLTGNLKSDLVVPVGLHQQAQQLRDTFGVNRNVWIAASTHEGEEEIILRAFAGVREALRDCFLILVPRHPERFASVAARCQSLGYGVLRRSERPESCAGADILLGDTMGELLLLYAASDLAFVGGSLVPHGGHNMLEPAALGVPVIAGSHLFNFREIAAALRDAGAMCIVNDAAELRDAVSSFLDDVGARRRAGESGKAVVAQSSGALAHTLRLLDDYIDVGGV